MSKANKMIAVIFGTKADALKGLNALKELHTEGSITLYSSVIAIKDNLDIVTMQEMKGSGAVHTIKGMGIGSLLGLLGGPAGFGIGLFAGTMAGLLYDMSNAGVGKEFIDDVSDAMKRNSVTLLAEVDEEQENSINNAMKAYHGLIFSRLRKETIIDQLTREISLNIEELGQLNSELNNSNHETKKKINTSVKETKKKLKILQKHSNKKLTDAKIEYKQKVDTLNDQLKDAKESKKTKIEQKKEKLKEEYEARYTKLKDMAEAAGKAL